MGVRTSQAKILIVSVFLLGGISCASWQRVGSDTTPDPSILIPELFDPSLVYRRMGLITAESPFPYVASIYFLAGPDGEDAFGAFALSLANTSLSFRRESGRWQADYRVELAFRDRAGRIVSELVDSQTVAIETLQETMRSDETIIYQRFIPIEAGSYTLSLTVEDEFSGVRSRTSKSVTVPDFSTGQRLSSVVPVYGVDVFRSNREIFPGMLVNPRASIRYGRDTLSLYLEAYGTGVNPVVDMRGYYVENEELIWSRAVPLERTGSVAAALLEVNPDSLPMGEVRFESVLRGTTDTVTSFALVGFSRQWALSNFEDILSLLRYFTTAEVLEEMRQASARERPALWDLFWRNTDPDLATPQHEALEEYFTRVEAANRMFRQTGRPGWLTDRGEVYLTIGGPEETFEPFPDPGSPLRLIRWAYTRYRVVLEFVDQTGFGEFRLTDRSRSDLYLIQRRIGNER